jgi:hypothetical protein
MVDVVGEPKAQITIVDNVAAQKNIVRIILLTATMRKDPRSITRSKI